MAFKLGGVRLRSTRGIPDADHARLLKPFWGYLPLRLIGGNRQGRNLTQAVADAADVLSKQAFEGWAMLANLQRLGAVVKVGRFEWKKVGWPIAATRDSFERGGRPARPRCPACGQPLPRKGRA